MTGIADRYRRRADAFEALIESTRQDQWSNPSPCEGWLAHDVVAHVVGYSAKELGEKAGVSSISIGLPEVVRTDESQSPSDLVPMVLDDPGGAFRRVRDAVQRVFDDRETSPAVTNYLDAALSSDLPPHTWDLAKATGQDATLNKEDVDLLWAAFSQMTEKWWDWQRSRGYFAAAVPIPEDAPLQDRLLGLIGRNPAWGT